MLEALILTLREGIEAALVVGIIVTFLRKEGAERYLAAVWGGLGTAIVASFVGAWALYRAAVNQEAFEGVLYLVSAIVVASFVVWMWRHSASVAGEVRGTLGRILSSGSGTAVAGGLFVFTFFMVVREGIETILFLSALSLTTSGLLAFFGAAIGIAAAATFGVLFVRGSVRIDLGRFFRITGIALMIFVVQLLFNAYHELSEAGWVPANETTMGLVGPLVRNEIFFFAAVLILPVLMLWMPSSRQPAPAEEAASAADARLARAAEARQKTARMAGGILGLAALIILVLGFFWSQPETTLTPAEPVTFAADGAVHLPLGDLPVGELHRYSVEVDGTAVRFIVMRLEEGDGEGAVVTGLDACLICGDAGYVQDEAGVLCLLCHSVIFPPSIGQEGGCNPIPLAAELRGGELVIPRTSFAAGGAAEPHDHAAHTGHAAHAQHGGA